MSRPGQIKGHKTSCKHSDSLYKMDPSKSSQGWFSQEVFYLKSFLFPWRRASMNFKWKPSLRLKGTQLQQRSCSLSCHQQRLISPGARRVLLLHCSCTSLQLASYPCFHWPLKNSILLGKKNQLQNHWKTVPFCSHYQGLSTALWAPFHLSLNKPFPLFYISHHPRLSDTVGHEVHILKSSFYCLHPKPLETVMDTEFQICILLNADQGKIIRWVFSYNLSISFHQTTRQALWPNSTVETV